MRSYGDFCPITKGAELFGERWTLLVVRELVCGATRFSEIQAGIPGIPKSLLAKRLKRLRDAGIIVRDQGDTPRKVSYQLTRQGLELGEVIIALGTWSQRWYSRQITEENVEPTLLLWDMHRRVHIDRLPDERVVAQFDLYGAAETTIWLVLERPKPSVCDFDPGFGVDVFVKADVLELTRVWMGLRSWKAVLTEKSVTLSGPSRYTREFPDWFQLNYFAPIGPGSEAESEPEPPVLAEPAGLLR